MQPFPYLIGRCWWRYFVTGRSLIGKPTDNATFLHGATVDLRGKPVDKLTGPIWHRLARRWAVLGVPLLLIMIAGLAWLVQEVTEVDPAWTRVDWFGMALRWWIVGALTLIGYGVYRAVQWFRFRRVTGEFVEPAWRAACDAMGHAYRSTDARKMIEIPPNFGGTEDAQPGRIATWLRDHVLGSAAVGVLRLRVASIVDRPVDDQEDRAEPSTDLVHADASTEIEPYTPTADEDDQDDVEDEPVVITLIPGKCSTPAEQKRFCQKVGPVLGMPNPRDDWYPKGRRPYVELRPNHPPPPEFTFADFRKYIKRGDIDHVPVGLSHGNRLEFLNFVDDTAHVLFSAEAGRGKSNAVKVVGSLLMHFGAQLVVLDRKLISHRWAHNLPGCTYASEIESTDTEPGIHELLVDVGAEIKRRRHDAIPDGADVDTPLNTFPTLVILVEEQNILSEELTGYWKEIRNPSDPYQSPAFTALRGAIYTGREFGIRVISVAQMATAMTFGANGGAARESFSTRVLGGWTVQAWKMLARGTPFVLCPKGRGIFAITQSDGRSPITRWPLTSDREARDLALSGIPSPGQPLGEVIDQGGAPVKVTIALVDPEMVTLRQAAEGNMLDGPPISVDALRKASLPSRDRDRRFPQPTGGIGTAATYRLSELKAWKTERDQPPLALGRRTGVVYQIDTLDPHTNKIEIGYIGQTRQHPRKREDQHRGDKPWADLIVGSPVIIWQDGDCTDVELTDAERDAIHRLKPRYNYEFQEGADHAMPLWEQEEERQLRQQARGLPRWVPEDRYQMSQMSQATTD